MLEASTSEAWTSPAELSKETDTGSDAGGINI